MSHSNISQKTPILLGMCSKSRCTRPTPPWGPGGSLFSTSKVSFPRRLQPLCRKVVLHTAVGSNISFFEPRPERGVRAQHFGGFSAARGGLGASRGVRARLFWALGGLRGGSAHPKGGPGGALFGPPFAEKVLKNVVNMCISEKWGFPGGAATGVENSTPNSCVYQFQGGLKS